jgi:hypothetical protein
MASSAGWLSHGSGTANHTTVSNPTTASRRARAGPRSPESRAHSAIAPSARPMLTSAISSEDGIPSRPPINNSRLISS